MGRVVLRALRWTAVLGLSGLALGGFLSRVAAQAAVDKAAAPPAFDVATCQSCHRAASASASANCSECHVYHDWSKAKPVDSKTTIQELLRR